MATACINNEWFRVILFSVLEKIQVFPDKQTTKCISSDSRRSCVSPLLGPCLFTTAPGCNPGRPLKAGARANKCCLAAHVPWRISQLWGQHREHKWPDDWQAFSSGSLLSELLKFADTNVTLVSGFTKARIRYIFFPQTIFQRQQDGELKRNRDGLLEANTHCSPLCNFWRQCQCRWMLKMVTATYTEHTRHVE